MFGSSKTTVYFNGMERPLFTLIYYESQREFTNGGHPKGEVRVVAVQADGEIGINLQTHGAKHGAPIMQVRATRAPVHPRLCSTWPLLYVAVAPRGLCSTWA